MVSFSCESCCDVLVKKKLDAHANRCRGAQFTCLDCSTTFEGTSYREHTSCISEAQKHQKSVYRPEKKKGKAKEKEKEKEKEKIKPDLNHQHSQNENDGNGMGSNGNLKNGAVNDKGEKAKEYEAEEKRKNEDHKGGEKSEETRAMKNAKEEGDKKRKRKSSEVGEEDDDSVDKLKKKKKGEEQEGRVKKQPKDKKSKNKDSKKSEENSSVPPPLVPSTKSSHKHDDASVPSTTIDDAHQPLATPTSVTPGAELPPSQALSSHHFLNSIPTGKEISMLRLIKKLKKMGPESEVWEFLKRAKLTKDKAGSVALVLP